MRPEGIFSTKQVPSVPSPFWAGTSHQIAQIAQSHFLAADERLAVHRADCPAPVTCPVAQVIEDSRRRGRPALDELRAIAADRIQLAVVKGRHVHDERWFDVRAQVSAAIIIDTLRVMRLAW